MSIRRIRVVNEYFHPWPNSAGFYLARAAGWYAEAGIDLEFLQPDPGVGDGLHYLLRGDAEAAVVPLNRLLQRRSAGQPVVAVAAVNQRALDTVRTVAATGITRLADLSGRRVGLNPTPRGLAVIRTLVERDGGDPDSIEVVDLGSRELTLDEIADGHVDATFGSYWVWDNLRDEATDSLVWHVDEHLGVSYHNYVLAVRHDTAVDDAATVQALVAATARGYRAAAEDPDSAAQLYETITPYFSRRLLLASARAVSTTWLVDGRWGTLRGELIGPYAQWLARQRIIPDAAVWPSVVATFQAAV
ncbi:myristoyl transferase [Mycolicibacterium anyangense]|uniref:Thiamine pyrimidine synthase n=1 Tax=Mycolicibacterium anyangense TaxID=1431246 RepID=A0A6N4W535_9MYCO|nr:ABC transporter substrate-binding protein [Mycolicibacterium anyangense]BBZ75227.1 myristoyl transferase [Mycolicibacterium anyangense]